MDEADSTSAAPEVSDEPLVEAPRGEEEPVEEPDTPQSLDLAVDSEAAAGTVLETAFHVSSSPGEATQEGGASAAAQLLRDAVARFSLESAGAAFGEDEALLDDGLDGDSVVLLSASPGSSDDDEEPTLPPADAAQPRPHSTSSAASRPRSSQPRPSSARDARASGTRSPGGTLAQTGGSSTLAAATQSTLPPEVAALHAFLDRTGGPCGGWDSRDHAVFRRLATHAGWPQPHGGPPSSSLRDRLVDAVLAALPGLYARAEVEAHAEWDALHEALLGAKREALAQWKAAKETAAAAAAAEAAAREEQRRRAEAHRLAQERAARAAGLEAWRAAQAQAALEEERQATEDAVRAVAGERARKAQEAGELKARMAAVQAAKAAAQAAKEADVARAAEAEKQRRREVAMNAASVRAQAETRVRATEEARKAREAVKAAPLKERQARLAKATAAAAAAIESRVSDDPRRVLAPTAAQRSREQAAQDVMRTPGLGIESLSHRAVPSWRQGL